MAFKTWVSIELQLDLEVIYPWWRQLQGYVPEMLEEQGFDPQAFHVLPRKWVALRTFSWLGRNRRLSKDSERLGQTTETWYDLAMRRLTRP